MPRTIIHADMDAFFAAVEQRDDPSLRGKPVIVGGAGKRGVVSTASYEARKFGVHSAMPGARAKQLCPQGIFVPGRMEAYAEVSRQIREVFGEFTPLIEPLSMDEAFLDVTGSRDLFGDGPAIGAEIKRLVFERTQLTISVGVASSKFVAKVASDLDKPDGIVVVPDGEEEAFLSGLPIKRLWGAGPKMQERFAQYGLKTIGDVQALSHEDLVAWLGESAGEHYWVISHGCDTREVVPERGMKSVSHETTFGEDLRDDVKLAGVLLGLSENVGRRLRKMGLKGRVLRLKIRFPPFETKTRQRKIALPTDDDLVIHRTGLELMESVRRPGQPVRLIGIGVTEFCEGEKPRQQSLFAEEDEVADEKSSKLLQAMDSIRDRFGEDVIRHGR